MKLTKIAFCDFRSFRGYHEIDVAPRDAEENSAPIILFGGLNGAGKTSILTAVRVALYGPSALGVRASSSDYEKFLRGSIHNSQGSIGPASSAFVEVQFEYGKLGERLSFRVQRAWSLKGSRVSEELRIWQDDEQIRGVDRVDAQSFLNELIPLGVSNLFFFDGEKISELAEDQDGSALKDAVRRLVGIDVAERLRNDLGAYLRRWTVKSVGQADQSKLSKLRDDYEAAKKDGEILGLEVEEEEERLATLREQLGKKEAALRSLGGRFSEARDETIAELELLKHERAGLEQGLREMAAGLLPLTLAKDQLEEAVDEASREHKRENAEERVTQLGDLANTLTDEAAALGSLDPKSVDWFRERILVEIERELAAAPSDGTLVRFEAGARELKHWEDALSHLLPDSTSNAKAVFDRLNQIIDGIEVLELRVARAPVEERLEKALSEMQFAQEQCDSQLEVLTRKRYERSEALKEAIKRGKELKAFTERVNANAAMERPVEYAQRLRGLLKRYTTLVSEDQVRTLEREFESAFFRLARKDDLNFCAEIDPETYQVRLLDPNRSAIDMGRLSAGERQIYAVAMLEALANTSGRRLPMIIDTPLGRLDSEHRKNLIEHYFPHASHQVLILSTDTEVDPASYRSLNQHVSHAFEIKYDSATSSSEIREGYFWASANEIKEAG